MKRWLTLILCACPLLLVALACLAGTLGKRGEPVITLAGHHLILHPVSVELSTHWFGPACGLDCPPLPLAQTTFSFPGFSYHATHLAAAHFHVPHDPAGKLYRRNMKVNDGLLLPFVVAPLAAWLWMAHKRRRLRQRLDHGLCPTCGYDLRAQHAGDAGNKCPECGTALAGLRPQAHASPV